MSAPEPEPDVAATTAEEGVPPDAAEDIDAFELLDECTQDTTSHAPKDKVELLAEAAMGFEGGEAIQVALWISKRLGADEVPVRLKTLQLVSLFLDVGSEDLTEAIGEHATDAVAECTKFAFDDPKYGDRPAAMIRQTATKVFAAIPGAEAETELAPAPQPATEADDGPAIYGRGSVLTGDAGGEDLFAKALRNRKLKKDSEAVSSKSRVTLKAGAKGAMRDLYDSSYLSTKHWRVTLPGPDAEVINFISVRHSGDDLIVLLNGEPVKEFINDEQLKALWKGAPGMEADFVFTLPGGLGGSISVNRLSHNQYQYSIEVPGEILDMSEHWLTATIELGAIYVRQATVESKDTADAFILYEVQTFLRSAPRSSGHAGFITRKRFSEFDKIHKLIKSSMSSKLVSSKKFVLPKKPAKTLLKKFDQGSVEKRRSELENYLQELIRIPAIGSNPDVLRFLNVPINAKQAGEGRGSGADDLPPPTSEQMENCSALVQTATADDETKPPPEALGELARISMGLEPVMARHLAASLAERLGSDRTAVKLKSLNLLATWVGKGSSTFLIAAGEVCLASVEEACHFAGAVDPVHGTKPTELVQKNAAKLAPVLINAAADANVVAQARSVRVASEQVVAAKSAVQTEAEQRREKLLGAETIRMLQECTTNDTEPAPPRALEQLVSAISTQAFIQAEDSRGNTAAGELFTWLGERLEQAKVPAVKLKTITLVLKFAPACNPDQWSALRSACTGPATSSLDFSFKDPAHGDLPARMVRKKAQELLTRLGPETTEKLRTAALMDSAGQESADVAADDDDEML